VRVRASIVDARVGTRRDASGRVVVVFARVRVDDFIDEVGGTVERTRARSMDGDARAVRVVDVGLLARARVGRGRDGDGSER